MHHGPLRAGERVRPAVGRPVGAEDVRDLEGRPRAGRKTGAARTARHDALPDAEIVQPLEGLEGNPDAIEHRLRDGRVAHRRADRAMAEELLDRAQVGAGFE
jgi:hypothetical protein